MQTETLDKLYLEWSQFTQANTAKEIKMASALDEMTDVLEECEAYFDNKADADHDESGFVPNREMVLLSAVKAAIALHTKNTPTPTRKG